MNTENTEEERAKKLWKMAAELDALLPQHVSIDGNDHILGQFQGADPNRKKIKTYDAMKILHKAQDIVARMISV